MKGEELAAVMAMDEVPVEEQQPQGEVQEQPEATQEQPSEQPEEEKPEEVTEETTEEVAEMSEERVSELQAKHEAGELTEEEIEELKNAGYELEQPDRMEELKSQLDAGEELDFDDLTEDEVKALQEAGYEVEEVSGPIELDEVEKQVLSSLNENLDFNNPEAVREAQINAMSQFSNIVNNFQAAVEANPEAEQFLAKLIQEGENFDFQTQIAIALGSDDLAPQPGEPGYKEYMKEQAQREVQREQQKAKEKERKQNLSNSRQKVQDYFLDNKVPEDRQRKIVQALDDYVIAFNNGDVAKYIDVFAKGLFRDQDIESETTKATARAKNGQWVKKKSQVSKPQVKSSNISQVDDSDEVAYVNSMLGLT